MTEKATPDKAPKLGSGASHRAPATEPGDVNPFNAWLNRKLRGIFDDLAQEPLPQRIVDLARKVESQSVPAQEPASSTQPLAGSDTQAKRDG